jgi:hypothetical protein
VKPLDVTYTRAVLSSLSGAGIGIEPGLTKNEIARIEALLSFEFPPDLREFLGFGLPVGKRFPDWRHGSEEELKAILGGPAHGVAFVVSQNCFWWREWGPRPDNLEEAVALARAEIANAPTLVPVFAHRFIPTEPAEEGNPVFSVSQTDVIVYGSDLADYFANEFHVPRPHRSRSTPKRIRFWSDLATWGALPIAEPGGPSR